MMIVSVNHDLSADRQADILTQEQATSRTYMQAHLIRPTHDWL